MNYFIMNFGRGRPSDKKYRLYFEGDLDLGIFSLRLTLQNLAVT